MKIYYKEDQNIEFMESWNSTELLKWICGFANAKGCKMYIGVRDDGEVIGLSNSKKLMEDIPNAIVSAFGNRTEAYIDELVSGILKNDIEKRYGIRYTASFERMAQHLMNIAPVKINSMDLSEEFGFKSSYTADNYVEYLERVYLLCMVSKHSYKSQIRVYNIKAYPVDIALMNRRKDAFAGENLGWRLETVVLIELLRRYRSQGMDIAYLQERNGECDFLVCRGRNTELSVQVSYDISKESTFRREIKGLMLADEKTGCRNLLLITDHEERIIQENGLTINVIPAYSWLVDSHESL